MKKYAAILERADDGGWGAYVPDLPGCTSWGETRDAAAENVKDAVAVYAQTLAERGQPLPEPRSFATTVSLPLRLA